MTVHRCFYRPPASVSRRLAGLKACATAGGAEFCVTLDLPDLPDLRGLPDPPTAF
jgi:hypothetical protein